MSSKKISIGIFLLFFISVFSPYCVSAKVFSSDSYCLYQNESILMCPFSMNAKDFSWTVDNSNVANVDKNGILTAKGLGECYLETNEINTNKKYRCKIKVLPSKHILSFHYFINREKDCQALTVSAVTDKDVKKLDCVFAESKTKIMELNFIKEINQNKIFWQATFPKNTDLKSSFQLRATLNNNNLEYSDKQFNVPCDYLLGRMKNPSENLIKFISSCEGFSESLIPDCQNKFSIGHGHVVEPFVPFKNKICKEEACSLLLNDINSSYGKYLNNFLVKNNIVSSQHQFDALLSFTYNLGIGWLFRDNSLKALILNLNNNSKNEKIYGKITSNNGLNIRNGPDLSSKIITAIPYGEEIEILNSEKYNSSWYFIKTKGGITGYCFYEYVKIFKTPSSDEKNLNYINKDEFIKNFCDYHHANRSCSTSLLSRRFLELDMFFDNKYSNFDSTYYKKSKYPIPSCMLNSKNINMLS